MMDTDDGRVASPPGSHPSGHAASGVDGASRFDPSRGRLLLKPFRVETRGFPGFTVYAPSRGKALAKAWEMYTSYNDTCRFGDYLKLATAYGAVGTGRFGDPIIVAGKPAFFVSNDPQYVQFVRPDSDVIMNSHPYDVLPVEYRPSTYRDRDSDGSGEASETPLGGSTEGDSAGRNGIARTPSPPPSLSPISSSGVDEDG